MKTLLSLLFSIYIGSMSGQVYATDSDIGVTPDIQYVATSNTVTYDFGLADQAKLLGTPVAIYEYVRNSSDYALYHGARAGSVGAFMAGRGNDVDTAATLIAMLRSQGTPARYVVGTVRMPSAKVMAWLQVENAALAASLLKDQGIQNVTLSSDQSTIDFEHVWVEASIAPNSYRGTRVSGTNCSANESLCNWIPLDPSFKQYRYSKTALDPYASNVSFDYTGYYNALKNTDAASIKKRDKDPLEIYQEQLLGWLQTNSPGKTLADIPDYQGIMATTDGVLPSSPPFMIVNSPRRYNSAKDHDAAVPGTEPKKWKKLVNLQLQVPFNGSTYTISTNATQNVYTIDLATKTLTVSTEMNGTTPNMVVRLDGVEIARPIMSGLISGYTPALNNPFSILVSMDGPPTTSSTGTDTVIAATYQGTVGGYYLVATGGENSGWNQVHKAAFDLLGANLNYPIVFNPNDSGTDAQHPCDPKTHMNCTPYVDVNSSGAWNSSDPKLLNYQPAMDALTKGLLNVAATQYYAGLHDSFAQLDALNKTKTPIEGFLGVVSSTYQAEYIDGTAYSILPGGLLIDMKGITIGGSWRIDQPAAYSNSQFELMGHITSSLEHETWQKLTGYDAISTVRGIQIALANGASLVDAKKNTSVDTASTMYSSFGFSATAPAGFTLNERAIYGTKMASWSYATTDSTQPFIMIKRQATGTTDTRLVSKSYKNDFNDGNLSCFYTFQNNLQTFLNTNGNVGLAAGSTCYSTPYANGTKVATVIALNQTEYQNYRTTVGTTTFDYLDEIKGFVPTDFAYRTTVPSALAIDAQLSSTVISMQQDMYGRDLTQLWVEYVIPSKLSYASNYRFEVDIRKVYDSATNDLIHETYEIMNMQGVSAGGGYVDGIQTLTPATSIALSGSGTSPLPTFDNSTLNSQNTINEVNNNTLKTPSTADPVSTVTGNNYHDETDFVIKGRGLNYVFTRTYNSAPSSSKTDIGLGYGWVHSYGMRLKSNDYGACPDCTSAQAAVNGNSKTSSVTYTDERGGDHNYLVNESTLAVTPPAGEFDSLTFDSNTQATLTFRNGTRYVFEYLAGSATVNLQKTPGTTARLKQIADQYGNQLNFIYDTTTWPGKLIKVADNLAIAGRTGITFSYDATNHISGIADWTGRSWTYQVDSNSNLFTVFNPLSKTITYNYGANGTGGLTNNPHGLVAVGMPEIRGGQPVVTFFDYYQNGKTFGYSDWYDDHEFLDYDLYRKTTRVTDPRGGIRTYEYDTSGRMTKLIEPDGATLFFNNNTTDGLRYSKTDGLGYVTQYSYKSDKSFGSASDTSGNVTREQDALLQNVDTTYGLYDQIATVTDKRGITRTNAYYTTNGTCAVAGKLQNVTLSKLTINGTAYTNVLLEDYCWNTNGTLASKNTYIDPAVPTRKRVTTYTYQAGSNGLNVSQITVSGSGVNITKTFGYDNLGRKTSETLQRTTSATNAALLNLSTSYEYDALDRNTAVIDALGNRMETVYDGNGKVYQIIARYKKTDGSFDSRTLSTRVYDAADRLSTDTDVYGKTTTYSYDSSRNVLSTTDANGHVTKYEYDAMNRRTAVIDANGSRTQTTYDLAGHVVAVTNANNETVSNVYDKIGRVTQTTDAKGYISTFAYDANNNLTCTIDANAKAGLQAKNTDGCSQTRLYDELNRAVQVNDALNGITKTSYDLLGNVTSITDASNKTTTNSYDDLGRLIKVTDPLIETPTDKVDTYTYDEAGNVLTYTNRLGQVTRTSYDQLNRPYKTEYLTDGKTDNITYDIYGNPYIISNANVTYTLLHDNKNRLTQKTDSRLGKTLSFTYDNVGNILTKTDYQNFVTEYRYDSTNQLVSLKNPDFLEVSYQYDAAGRQLSRILSNGAQTSTTYDKNGWPLTLKHLSANGTVVGSTSYTRDRVGNILTQIDSSGNTTFIYDALYRIKTADYPGTAFDESFVYDSVGNRQTQTLNGAIHAYEYYASSNRLKALHTSTLTGGIEKAFAYDDAGRMTIQTGTGAKTFTWNQKNQANVISTNGKTINYTYDPMSYRIGTSGSSKGTLDYYLEGENLEAIYTGTQLQAAWLRGRATDELVAGWVSDATSQANPSSGTIGSPYIYAHDNQNSVAGISGHDGTPLEQMTYTAFGTTRTDTGSTATMNANTLRYTGREQDPDTGLYYNRARYYDPSIGRFPSEDPKGFAAGMNFYAYVDNNPVNANDPSGLDTQITIGYTHTIAKGLDHTFTILTDTVTGKQFATRAGPECSSGCLKGLGGGQITAIAQPYDSTFQDQPYKTQEVGVILRDYNDSVSDARNFANVTNQNKISYWPFGQNSNAYNTTFVGTLTGTRPQLIGNTPGSDFSVPSKNLNYSPAPMSNSIGTTDFWKGSASDAAAAGGFLLYPNKPNNNQMQSVYSK